MEKEASAVDERELSQAFADLAVVRRAIERATGMEQGPRTKRAVLGARLVLQVAALALALALAIIELVTGHINTYMFLISERVPELKSFGLAQLGLALIGGYAAFYLLLILFSRRAGQTYEQFIARNFSYLKNFSFLADLLIKYLIISLLVIFDRPGLVAPVLSAFIADYLFQGRFFTLSFAPAMILGVLCLAAAGAQLYTGTPLLIYPLALFCIVALSSIVYLLSARMAKIQGA